MGSATNRVHRRVHLLATNVGEQVRESRLTVCRDPIYLFKSADSGDSRTGYWWKPKGKADQVLVETQADG